MRYWYGNSVRLSVCLSVRPLHGDTEHLWSDNPTILVFWDLISERNSDRVTSNGASNTRWAWKLCDFRPIEKVRNKVTIVDCSLSNHVVTDDLGWLLKVIYFSFLKPLWINISGCSPCSKSVMLGSPKSEHPRLTTCNSEIIFEVFQPMCPPSSSIWPHLSYCLVRNKMEYCHNCSLVVVLCSFL